MYSIVVAPPYLAPYSFEIYDYAKSHEWFINYWWVSGIASAIYFVMVFGGRQIMANRAPYKLNGLLLAWNLFLSLGSLFMFLRIYPELFDELKNHGVVESTCSRERHSMTASFWIIAFTWSKILEFGDTAFIVLRKQKLMFLHWYHHITVCMYCFYSARDFDPASRWFAAMNTFIHTIMYGYYALRAAKIRIPTPFAMVITSLQILQMIVGMMLTLGYLFLTYAGVQCDRPKDMIPWSLLMYFSYLVLFANFFIRSYVKTERKEKKLL